MKPRWLTITSLLLLIASFSGCLQEKPANKMSITSSAFQDQGDIPSIYTCDGEDIHPPLEFHGIPNDTVSLVLIMDDPDAGYFTHWIIWNIPPNTTGFKEGENLSYPEGVNDFGFIGYGGPCPPKNGGKHHYKFTLYALDTTIDLPRGATREQVDSKIKGHIIDKAELTGLYGRVS